MNFRIGFGYDVHRFELGRKLILGGIEIPFYKGLLGHSDADVLIHAIIDGMLGALALGDIGKHFPDSDDKYRNVDSKILLAETNKIINDNGYVIGNVDSTIVAENPKLNPFILKMREKLASILNADVNQISVKATTSEKMGFVGIEEGVKAFAVVMLNFKGE